MRGARVRSRAVAGWRPRAPGHAARLRGTILGLAEEPRPPGSAKLAGTSFWRLRVGDMRVVYLIDGDDLVVILRVARRAESTYRRV
jgi:mRNA interferase RelE/StbE